MKIRALPIIAALLISLISPAPYIAVAAGGFASAPLDVTPVAIAGGIRVTWTTPADIDNGITGFRIESSSSGNSGTWSLATTVASNIRSHDLLGLSQVATYIRIAATTGAGIGTYGYPWIKIYGTTAQNRDSSGNIVYETGFGLGAGNASTTHASASFSRIRYRMDATISGTASYAETDFYKWVRGDTFQATSATAWDPSVESLRIPTINAPSRYVIQANVTDLNIFSDSAHVIDTVGSSGMNGRLEIWPYNYGPERSSLTDGSVAGSASNYDFNDTPANNGSYGSFQVHDMANSRPVFVWNNNNSGAAREIAFGPNRFAGHPDWTFCTNVQCPQPSAFRLQIFVNIPVTPLLDSTSPTVSRIDTRALIKNGDTLTVASNELGTAYLIRNTIAVSSLSNITGAAANLRNSASISSANTSTTLTTSGLLDGTYNLYAADLAGNLSSGVLATVRLDSTAPTISSFSVAASGQSVQLISNETVTLTTFAAAAYSLSDQGSAISVTSASLSGLTITLNLSRAIPAGATVTFAYSPSSVLSTNRWLDFAGNQLDAIASRTIANNSSAAISVSLEVPSSISKGVATTITSVVSVAGLVTFTLAGKRIPGCRNKVAIGSTPISVSCTFKPALSSHQVIRATLVPTVSAYPTTVAVGERFILRRTNTR